MLAAAFAQARTSRLHLLQCRHKSNLSAINRTLDLSIRRDRRKSVEVSTRDGDDRKRSFPRHDRSDSRGPTNYETRRDRDSSRGNDYASSSPKFSSDRNDTTYQSFKRRDDKDQDFKRREPSVDDRFKRGNREKDQVFKRRDQGDGRSFTRRIQTEERQFKRRDDSKDDGFKRRDQGDDRSFKKRDQNEDWGFKRDSDKDDGLKRDSDKDWGFKMRGRDEHQDFKQRSHDKTSHSTDRDSHPIQLIKDHQAEGFMIRKTNKQPDGEQEPLTKDQERDILKVPFAVRYHFTEHNWERLMSAARLAEDNYINALPKRPSTLPVYDKDQPGATLELKRQLKKIIKADFELIEPTLRSQRRDWLRVIKHIGEALKNAKSKYIFIPGRPWFTDRDPQSALKASVYPIQPPANLAQGEKWAEELHNLSVLNQDMRKDLVAELVSKYANAIISGKDVNDPSLETSKPDQDSSSGSLGFGQESKQEKRKRKEQEEKMQKFAEEEEKERRKLLRESLLDDDQLSSSVRNNREKHQDGKNKNKEIQEPRDKQDRDDRSREDRDVYISIPYTTAASEFLYGLNVVLAALKANRRKIYNLYIHNRALSNDQTSKTLRSLCKKASITWTDVDDDFLPKMDKMAQGRPHNGVILESSPLPTLPTKSLGKMNVTTTAIPIDLADQSAEEAKINGAPTSIPFHHTHTWRKPLVLLLDGILDPGNLGNILRTAHFYGVDAIALCKNTCAPVNLPVVQKAASGAAEALTILSIPTPANFITVSKKQGWIIHAAVAPNSSSSASSASSTPKRNLLTDKMTSPLAQGPSILMIGAEGEGLRANLATKADVNVGIRGFKSADLDVGVDSLNVASSVAVLLEAFMRKPDNLEDIARGTPREEDVAARIV